MYRIFTKLENGGGGQYYSSIADIVEFCKNRKRLQIISLLLPSCTVDGLNIIRDITESLVEIPKETSDTLHLEILRFCYELDNDNQKELQIIDMLLTKNPNDWLALCRKIEITKDRDCIRDIVTQYQDSTFDRIESQNDKANSKGLESQILLYTAAKALFDSQQSISPITNLEDCYISLVCLQKALEFPEQHEMLDIGGFFKTLARDNDNTIFSYYLGSKNICRYRLAPSHAEIYLEIASILLPISLVCEDKEIAEEARQNFEKAKKFVKLMQDKNKQDLMQEEIDSFNTALLYMVLEDFKKAKDSLTTAQDEGENIILKMILDIYDCIRQKDSKRLRDSIEILCEAIRKYNKHIDSAKHKLSEMPEIADKFLQVQEILGQELKIQQTIGMLIERNKEQTTDICGILLSNCIIPKLCAHGHMTEALYILCVAEMYNFASLSLIPAYLQIGEYDRCLELIEKEIPLESSEQSNHKEYKQKQLLKYKLIAYMHLKQNREIKKILKEEMQKDGKWAIEMYLVLLQQRLLQLEIIALQSQDSKQDNEQINKKNCEKEYTQHVEILRHKARIYQFDSKLHAFCRQLNPAITIKEGVKDNTMHISFYESLFYILNGTSQGEIIKHCFNQIDEICKESEGNKKQWIPKCKLDGGYTLHYSYNNNRGKDNKHVGLQQIRNTLAHTRTNHDTNPIIKNLDSCEDFIEKHFIAILTCLLECFIKKRKEISAYFQKEIADDG